MCETHFDHNNDVYAFVMELMVVRINWEHILAFAPKISGGNIYWTKSEHFWDAFLQKPFEFFDFGLLETLSFA